MKINFENLKSIIRQGEGYNLEFKSTFSKSTGNEFCAFANANGGTILLGITDKGKIKGFRGTVFPNPDSILQ